MPRSEKMEELREVTKQLPELFGALANSLPKLINTIMETMYSEEAAQNLARAVGTFYRELVDQGFPEDEALRLASEYMIRMNTIMDHARVGRHGD